MKSAPCRYSVLVSGGQAGDRGDFEKIGTYETSILPSRIAVRFFVAKHTVTKPNLAVIKRHEENLKDCIDEMMQRALDTEEMIVVERSKAPLGACGKSRKRQISIAALRIQEVLLPVHPRHSQKRIFDASPLLRSSF